MLRLSFNTFAERWPLFTGAILTVATGVALVQSSLLILVSAATQDLPPGLDPGAEAQMRDAYEGAVSLLGITLGIAYVLAIFIVSSTFAFTVAQRRRDLALLRLVGGSRGQLRRLLLSEALLLALFGSAIGVPLGILAEEAQSRLLVVLELIPPGFSAQWHDWILAVSFGVGIGVALTGVFAASRRAATVRPLDALRDVGDAARVMTAGRWIVGLLFTGGAVAMAIVSAHAPPEGAIALSANIALVGAIGLSMLSPLLVPLVGRAVGLVLRGTTLGGLAAANLRDAVRRTASTAAPLIVLSGLLIGLTGTLLSISNGIEEEQARDIAGDLVVTSTAEETARIASIPGVAAASAQTPVTVTLIERYPDGEGGEAVEREDTGFLAMDPAAYQQTHTRTPAAGSLDDLHGETVVVERGFNGHEVGDTIEASVAGREVTLRVVAVFDSSLSYDGFLLPRDLVSDEQLAQAPTQTIVRIAAGTDVDAVSMEIRAAGLGEVYTVAESISRAKSAQDDLNWRINAVIMGLSGLYALIAVINSVVIATSERKTEFAVARLSGLSRAQVLRMAFIESWAVATIALLLSGLAAGAALLGIRAAIDRLVGVPIAVVPWTMTAVVVAGSFLVVGAATLCTAAVATRPRPTTLATARE
ncbi:FtsX-like permease family protein [Glycomyces tenuis]|uniref:FtsX-like permease family protein n=1 Tax=Glycomyces tenuis TaxID=58116 RepID=UPI000425AD3B|nr:FtsX-like permease family protein [Glycomyces tenuis]